MKHAIALFLLVVWSLPSYALDVGDVAPDFSLQGSDGKVHRLADYRGKETVVLAWFPKAFSRGCTIECKSLAENGHLIKKFAATYFMASVDPIDDNVGFAKEQKADFPLLSDPSRQTALAYNVLSGKGYADRQTFYIGKDGKILAIDRNVHPATSAEDMIKMLARLGTPRVEE